jgi:cyanate permease
MKRFEQIPFDPARWPFFYGWMVLAWGILGVLLSVPGQTTGLTAFVEPLLQAFAIDRVDLTDAYFIGTFASSFLLTPAGKLFDRIGARWMGFAACAMLGISLLLLSQSMHAFEPLTRMLPRRYAVLVLFGSLVFLLRLSGQGVLTMASRNMIMKWFDRRRGMVSGIVGAATAYGFSYAPTGFHMLIGRHGWSGAWFLMGLALIFLFAPLLLLFFRDHPEASGLMPDGKVIPLKQGSRPDVHHEFTLAEARRTWAFWAFTLTICIQALALTAVGFHLESIFHLAGMARADGFRMLPPAALIAVVMNLAGGWLSSRIELRWLLTTMLLAMAGYLLGFILLRPGFVYGFTLVGFGVSNGMFGVLMTLTWPRYFGRAHLGAISGLCMSFMVVFSAVGPAFFGRSLDHAGSYAPGFLVCLAATLLLLLGSLRARNPQLSKTV